ncbi:MAG: hypothetical protein FJW39_11660 [Acidobacteria bacterium]|nr:hypothetical protein [Acidobacteriota bacterium]
MFLRAVLLCLPLTLPAQTPPAALRAFDRGLAWLHNFEYTDARREFQAARKLAPRFAMAYWGEAMTYNEPLWMAQDRDAARAVLRQRPAMRLTPREEGYLGAAGILFGEGDSKSRDHRYAEAMGRLAAQFPADTDAAAFYALALLGTCHNGRDTAVYMRAAAILEEQFARAPDHPGVLHYLIHCYDDPQHAPLGLRAARRYARVASASHALHMPSHIFAAMGSWEAAAASNEAAWRAAGPRSPGGYHALWWLAYCYLQQGRFAEARKLVEQAGQLAASAPQPLVRFHAIQMRAAWRIETGEEWNGAAIALDGLDLSAHAADLFSRGIIALNRGNPQSARAPLGGLLRTSEPQSAGARHAGHHPVDRAAVTVAAAELEALLLMSEGRSRDAIDAISRAAELEDRMSYEFGPPSPPKPARELYGELLLQLDRRAEAAQQFELALKRYPGRALALLGLWRTGSQTARVELSRVWTRADPAIQQVLKNSGGASR